MQVRGLIFIMLTVAAVCCSAGAADAAKGDSAVRAQHKAARQANKAGKADAGAKAKRGHYSFGKITAISGDTITIKPETPDFVAQRQAASGRAVKPLPASLSFSVNSETTYMRSGQTAKLGDYKTGDEVAAVLTGKVRSGQGVALKLLDLSAVQATYGKGGRFGLPPVYGTVLAVDKSSIKIKPEVPDFVAQRREERRAAKAAKAGLPAPAPKAHKPPKLAAEVTASITGLTQYWQNSAQVQSDPFKAGDHVAIYPARDAASLTAASVRDYATVQSGAARKSARGARKSGKAGQARKGARRGKKAHAGAQTSAS